MRVRLIRPSYWTDADLHTRLTADVREFYIGCWMEADDAGFIDWDIPRLGAELYPFHSLAWRQSRIERWTSLLGDHLVVLECGRHAYVPNLTKYQNVPRPSDQHRRAHARCIRQVAAGGTTGQQMAPDGTTGQVAAGGSMLRQVPEGKVREGKGREEGSAPRGANGLTNDEATTELGRKIAAAAGD